MPFQHKVTLTEKKKAFCQQYMVDKNGKQAAIRAGYSAKTAAAKASMLLAEPEVKLYLQELMAPLKMDLTVTAERVLNELARIAFHDVASFYDEKGKLKDLKDLTEDQRAAISEVDATAKRLKLHDKMGALSMLGKHLKLFTELHEQQHTFTIMPTIKRGGKEIIFNVGSPVKKKDPQK